MEFRQKIPSENAFPELGSTGTPPLLTTNGSAQYLDHLSVKGWELPKMQKYIPDIPPP